MDRRSPHLVALAAALVLVTGCNRYKARREMAEGKQDYNKANYQGAIEHFKAAAALDDQLLSAKFALAGAYVALGNPGGEDEHHFGQQAVDMFLQILKRSPKNVNALKQVCLLDFYMAKFEDAATYCRRAVSIEPDDSDPYYILGVLDWWNVYRNVANRKAKYGLRFDDEFGSSAGRRHLCTDLQSDNQTLVGEGLAMLQKAMDKRQDYDDAMAYTSLFYRLKANIDCDKQARLEHLRLSQKWFDEGIAARRRSAAHELPTRKPEARDKALETGNLPLLPLPPPPPPPPAEQYRLHEVPK